MKSDLTCPIEVIGVSVSREADGENERILCGIRFFNLSENTVDSVQMNIICFGADGQRIGGRLVRSAIRGAGREQFEGWFSPEHVDGTVRVEASVEKVWFLSGVIWRREDRNVREYENNALPEGRELDRLRAVAGQDAAGYPKDGEIVWLCVCGRANPVDEKNCVRCRRARAQVMKDYSYEAVDRTAGERERELERSTRETLEAGSLRREDEIQALTEKRKKRNRALTVTLVLLVLAVLVLSAARWGVPWAACRWADHLMETEPARAEQIYLWVDGIWQGWDGAAGKALDAEEKVIGNLISENTEESLLEAQERADTLTSQHSAELSERAQIDRAVLLEQQDRNDEAEALLRGLPENEEAQQLLRELLYSLAGKDADAGEYETAAEMYGSLGSYLDSADKKNAVLYDWACSLEKSGEYEKAGSLFEQVTGLDGAVEHIRVCRYQLGLGKQESGDLAGAAELFETLGVYEDAAQRAQACRYQAGMDALGAGDLETAAEDLRLAGDYEDAAARRADAVLTLGARAEKAEDYAAAAGWLEQIESESAEAAELLRSCRLKLADSLAAEGKTDEAAALYDLLGTYEQADEKAKALRYAAAVSEAEYAPESALTRFEALEGYKDSAAKAEECLEKLTDSAFAAGDLETALDYALRCSDTQENALRVRRCRYALAQEHEKAGEYEAAASLYEACGAYLDAEEGVSRTRYEFACSLQEAGEYGRAREVFLGLGSYSDAKERVTQCEDAWLSAAATGAELDMELGDYDAVIAALEILPLSELPERYASLAETYEQACLALADKLTEEGKLFEALPVLEKISENAEAAKRLSLYAYRIIGRWKDVPGTEYVFRRDGTCSIGGKEGCFSGNGYTIFEGDEPDPKTPLYSVVSLKNGTLVLTDVATGKKLRLNYLGAPEEQTETPAEEK